MVSKAEAHSSESYELGASEEFQLKPSETLSGKDYAKFMVDVIKARNDPIWFTKEIIGFPLRPAQEEVMREYYRHLYNPALRPYKKLCLVAGQRSGKTALASCIVAYEFMKLLSYDNPSKHFGLLTGKSGRGQKIAVTCLATSRTQAFDGVFSNMVSFIEGNPWFEQWFDLAFRGERVECDSKNVIAQVLAAKADTSAGYTNSCVVFDELDLFERTDSKKGAEMVYTKLCNSTETFGIDGKIVAISSLQFPDGMMMRVYRDGLGEKTTLAKMYKTWEMNPKLTEEYLRDQCKYDMVRFNRDYANDPAASSGVQFPEGIIMNPDMQNLFECEPLEVPEEIRKKYRVLAVDPAYKNDSFGIAMGWREGNNIYIDGVKKFEKIGGSESFIRPSDVREYIINVMRDYHVTAFIHDVYMFPELLESVQYDLGLMPVLHNVTKEDYDRWRELQEGRSHNRLQLVQDEFLKRECTQLLVKETPGGRPKVDHPWNGSKDLADCVANCIWFLTTGDVEMEDITPIGGVMGFGSRGDFTISNVGW